MLKSVFSSLVVSCFLAAILKAAPLAFASDTAAATATKTVVVLGDSLAAGLGVEPQEAFPALLQQKVEAAGLKWAVVNAGVSGNTSADGLARIDRPTMIFVESDLFRA